MLVSFQYSFVLVQRQTHFTADLSSSFQSVSQHIDGILCVAVTPHKANHLRLPTMYPARKNPAIAKNAKNMKVIVKNVLYNLLIFSVTS